MTKITMAKMSRPAPVFVQARGPFFKKSWEEKKTPHREPKETSASEKLQSFIATSNQNQHKTFLNLAFSGEWTVLYLLIRGEKFRHQVITLITI